MALMPGAAQENGWLMGMAKKASGRRSKGAQLAKNQEMVHPAF
jgi:hypothetical protein